MVDENTIRVLMANEFTISKGYLPVHFFHELELWRKLLLTLFYFLMSMDSGLKLLEFRVYFLTSMNYMLKLLEIPVIRTPPIRTNFYRAYALLQLCSYFGKFYFCPTGFLCASSETANPTSLKG